jgi:hypothetical protein
MSRFEMMPILMTLEDSLPMATASTQAVKSVGLASFERSGLERGPTLYIASEVNDVQRARRAASDSAQQRRSRRDRAGSAVDAVPPAGNSCETSYVDTQVELVESALQARAFSEPVGHDQPGGG